MSSEMVGDFMYWKAGDIALLRYRRLGPVTCALPATVVDDDEQLTTLYLRPGTPIKARVRPDGEPIPRDIAYADRARIPVAVGDGI